MEKGKHTFLLCLLWKSSILPDILSKDVCIICILVMAFMIKHDDFLSSLGLTLGVCILYVLNTNICIYFYLINPHHVFK